MKFGSKNIKELDKKYIEKKLNMLYIIVIYI